jgi:hypothetical protein
MELIVRQGVTKNGEEYKVKMLYDHYILYIENSFYCTGDSMREILDELEYYENQK